MKKFLLALAAMVLSATTLPVALAETKKPNILVIWGDDVGMYNISAYHRGLMGGSTPNDDALKALTPTGQ